MTSHDALNQLARRVDAGTASLAELLRASRLLVCRWALVRTGDDDVAEDVAQEALIRIHRSFGDRRRKGLFTTWLYRVVANAAADEGRRIRRRRGAREALVKAELVEGESAHGAGGVEPDRLQTLLEPFLVRLTPRQRAAFELVDLQGLTSGEAATLEGISDSTLRVHLARARAILKEAIRHEGL